MLLADDQSTSAAVNESRTRSEEDDEDSAENEDGAEDCCFRSDCKIDDADTFRFVTAAAATDACACHSVACLSNDKRLITR